MLERISKYRIDSVLSQGAMGIVYMATDEANNQTVVIKTIHPNLLQGKVGIDFARRFTSEANAATRCQHENLISIYDVGQYQDAPFVVMEFVKGYGLDRLLQSLTPLPLECISDFFLGICAGLEYAHQQGFVHRDLKPTNILVLEDDTIKIADLGIAKIESTDKSLVNMLYKAPEQKTGMAVDCRADIYALGVIAFELLTLCDDLPSLLCQYTIARTIEAPHLNLNTKLPQSLVKFLDSCLSANASNRFNNMTEVIQAYETAIRNLNSHAKKSTSQHANSPDIGFNFDLDPEFLQTIEKKPTQTTPIKPIVVEAEPVPEDPSSKELLTAFELIRALKSIHPLLNSDWQETIPAILQQLEAETRRRCFKSILEPKGISLTSAGKLLFTSQQHLSNAKKILVTRQLNTLTDKLLTVVAAINKSRNILSIGDALEMGFKLISDINTNNNLAQQKEKIFLTESFLYDFATALRQHNFDVPENRRDLTVDIIKTYIIEVYIKQKILNYGFSPLPLRELKKDSHSFINTELFDAAKAHRLSIVPTTRYFFVIGEVAKFGLDPYSVRRFLTEDTSVGGRTLSFNILAIDRNQLADAHYLEKMRLDLSSAVTIQWQLNRGIIELVDKLENVQATHLLPLLMKPLETDDVNLQSVIEERLRDYERNLCMMVLNKITRCLKEQAKSPDDFEFLFFNLKSLLIESVGAIHDFYYQLSVRMGAQCQEMEFKLVAYLRLLEKRKNTVFNKERETVLAMDNELNYRKPTDELVQMVNKTIPIIQNLKDTLKEAQRQAAERTAKQKSWDTFLGRKHVEPTDVQKSIDQTNQESHTAIVNIVQRYQKSTINLEFEGIIDIDESVRHYAFPKGEEGISLLPMLIKLPENTSDFDIFAVKELLKPTLFNQLGNRLLNAGSDAAH